MSSETKIEEASERETQLAADSELIRSGGPGWHLAFKRFRIALGIGHKKLAKRIGVHPTTFTKWEHGRSNPTRQARERALAALGWTPPRPAARELPTPVSARETIVLDLWREKKLPEPSAHHAARSPRLAATALQPSSAPPLCLAGSPNRRANWRLAGSSGRSGQPILL